jgi:hypothetical protein
LRGSICWTSTQLAGSSFTTPHRQRIWQFYTLVVFFRSAVHTRLNPHWLLIQIIGTRKTAQVGCLRGAKPLIEIRPIRFSASFARSHRVSAAAESPSSTWTDLKPSTRRFPRRTAPFLPGLYHHREHCLHFPCGALLASVEPAAYNLGSHLPRGLAATTRHLRETIAASAPAKPLFKPHRSLSKTHQSAFFG